MVYGLNEAIEDTADGDPLVVVEGPFGVWHLVGLGYGGVVAVCGSSLSDEQAELLAGVLVQ